MHGAMNVK